MTLLRHTDRLATYFQDGIQPLPKDGRTVGVEIETMFLNARGKPISHEVSQQIFRALCANGWRVVTQKGNLVTEVQKGGHRILYELGRHNLELSVAPSALVSELVEPSWQEPLQELYRAARSENVFPMHAPVLETDENLLVIPDERDATWLKLDGAEALKELARCSSVQFSIDVTLAEAIPTLNRLGQALGTFLTDYPQETLWRRYIAISKAGYRADRYGGPVIFRDLEDYCARLAEQPIVTPEGLVSQDASETYDINLFLRSVWWYFRLRRSPSRLYIEVRPISRRLDTDIPHTLRQVVEIMGI